MASLKNIVVVGGSGLVGRAILKDLLANKADFGAISSLKRESFPTSEVLQTLQSQGVQVLEANFKVKASLVAAFKGM
jgi:uncharacterized protein YbjT (DUF2867 family)